MSFEPPADEQASSQPPEPDAAASPPPIPPPPPPPQGAVPPQRPGMPPPYVRRPAPARRGMSLGCLVAVIVSVALCGLVAVGFVVLMVMGTAIGGAGYSSAAYGGVQLQETTIKGRHGQPKVLLLPVRGLLIPGGLGGHDPVLVLKAMLREAADDKDLRAIVMVVDSPGGGITTCDVMLNELTDFRRTHRRIRVVALYGDVAASGGYYVSCGADYIMAHPTTITGSIGVLMSIYDVSRLMQMLGVTDRTVTSGDFKNMGSPFAQKTEEQRKREKEVFQELVNEMHARFVGIVAGGRKMSLTDVAELADGRIFTAQQAVENGLIDGTGYEDDAIKKAMALAGLSSARVVRYDRVRTLREMLLTKSGTSDQSQAAQALSQFLQTPRLMYLWCPQAAGSSG